MKTYTNYTTFPAALDLQALQRCADYTHVCTLPAPGVGWILNSDHVCLLFSLVRSSSKGPFCFKRQYLCEIFAKFYSSQSSQDEKSLLDNHFPEKTSEKI